MRRHGRSAGAAHAELPHLRAWERFQDAREREQSGGRPTATGPRSLQTGSSALFADDTEEIETNEIELATSLAKTPAERSAKAPAERSAKKPGRTIGSPPQAQERDS